MIEGKDRARGRANSRCKCSGRGSSNSRIGLMCEILIIRKNSNPSARLGNSEIKPKLRRFGRSSSSDIIGGNGKDVKIIEIRYSDVIGA